MIFPDYNSERSIWFCAHGVKIFQIKERKTNENILDGRNRINPLCLLPCTSSAQRQTDGLIVLA
jgi:hypothetical protein